MGGKKVFAATATQRGKVSGQVNKPNLKRNDGEGRGHDDDITRHISERRKKGNSKAIISMTATVVTDTPPG